MEALQSQLVGMRKQLEDSSKDAASERARREAVEKAMAVVKEEYTEAAAVLEGERAIAAGLKREAETLQQQVGVRGGWLLNCSSHGRMSWQCNA